LETIAKIDLKNIEKDCVTNPMHTSRFQKLENALNDLFANESKSQDSIFIKIAPNVVKKMALFLSGMAFRPAAIGVCGETASGKSTIVLDSIETIEKFSEEFLLQNMVTRINTDDYYFDRSKEVEAAGSFAEFAKNYDFDVPHAIELNLMKKHVEMLLKRQDVFLPKYEMSGTTKRFDNHTLAKPSPIIVSEGLFTLVDEIADVFDFKIYVHITQNVQKARFFERAQQRGLGDSAEQIFKNATEKASIYIHPCAQNADIILNGEISREKFKKFVSSFLLLVESILL